MRQAEEEEEEFYLEEVSVKIESEIEGNSERSILNTWLSKNNNILT